MSSRSRPRPLGDLVRAVRIESTPETALAATQAVWVDALGERIAKHAEPVRERDGVITVTCDAATWAQELDLLQNDLLERLNRALPGAQIERLRFVVGESRDNTTD